EQGDGLACRLVLAGDVGEPFRSAPRIIVSRFRFRLCEPVRTLPSGRVAEARARRRDTLVQRRGPRAACRLGLSMGPVHRIQETKALDGAVMQVSAIALEWRGPADVDVPQIERCDAIDDPVRDPAPRPTGGLDAGRVEAGCDE